MESFLLTSTEDVDVGDKFVEYRVFIYSLHAKTKMLYKQLFEHIFIVGEIK